MQEAELIDEAAESTVEPGIHEAASEGDELGTGNLGRNRGNDYARYLGKKYGLTPAQQREFHDEISGQNYGRRTLDEIAKEIGGGDR